MAETSTIFGFMKYVSATDILSDFKKTVDSHFVNSLKVTNSDFSFLYIYLSSSSTDIFNMEATDFISIVLERRTIIDQEIISPSFFNNKERFNYMH